jgi:hypothetical protein
MSAALCERAAAPAAGHRRWAVWLVLLGLLVVAHGCHGDEDHELLARLRPVTGQR